MPCPLARLIAGLLLVAVLCTAAGGAAGADHDFLSVDKAFAPSAQRVDAHHLRVSWKIADGYYLYRHAFAFTLVDAGKTGTAQAQIPPGDRHKDKFFGPVETYRHHLQVLVPTADNATLPEGAHIQVSYQGCADAGICYPPQKRTLTIAPAAVTADDGKAAAGTVHSGSASTATADTPQQTQLAQRLAGASPLSTLALFFGLGILLAFTPCILPMIPILAGLVVGSGAGPARAFGLSLAYVFAMALAYAVFGVVAGFFGANIQAALQMPAVLFGFAGIFVLLAGASFGWFDIQMPGAWQQRLGRVGAGRGGVAGAALMGFFSALIAGPCLAPPLAGALLYISTSGDWLLGGTALSMLGLGMGVPLILIAVFGAGILPRAGRWMGEVRVLFGVILLAVALWLATRLASGPVALAGWGALALGYGAYVSTRAHNSVAGAAAKRATVFTLWAYAALACLGLAVGSGRPLAPLAGLAQTSVRNAGTHGNASKSSQFARVTTAAQLNAALTAARTAHRAAVVDFYADWCVDCVRMTHTVFKDSRVRGALAQVAAIEVDVTTYDGPARQLLHTLDVFGPPTVLFYRPDGTRDDHARLIGLFDSDGFLARLSQVTGKPAQAGVGNPS